MGGAGGVLEGAGLQRPDVSQLQVGAVDASGARGDRRRLPRGTRAGLAASGRASLTHLCPGPNAESDARRWIEGVVTMSFADLRAFLRALEAARQLACVRVEVDPRFEVAAICRKALADGGPGLLFENVKGSRHAFAANLLASRERMAIALGVDPDALLTYWRDQGARLIDPVIVEDGPSQEEVLLGDDLDFGRFGLPTWNARDGGPYITFPCYISQNPATGGFDCGMYRTQVFDGRTLGFNAGPHRHLSMNRERSGDPDGRFPVAI